MDGNGGTRAIRCEAGLMIRKLLDGLYGRSRGLNAGFDPRLSTRAVLGFVLLKVIDRLRGIALGPRSAFRERGVTLRGKGQLRSGRSVAISRGVTIDARSINGVILGESVTIDLGAVLRASGVLRNLGVGISIGERSAVGAYNFLHGGGGIAIGADCLLGPNVSIYSENHRFELGRPVRDQGEERQRVTVGDDVWIGSGATILPGVTIGNGAVVAAGAVVTRDVKAFSIVAGVPARQIGQRE